MPAPPAGLHALLAAPLPSHVIVQPRPQPPPLDVACDPLLWAPIVDHSYHAALRAFAATLDRRPDHAPAALDRLRAAVALLDPDSPGLPCLAEAFGELAARAAAVGPVEDGDAAALAARVVHVHTAYGSWRRDRLPERQGILFDGALGSALRAALCECLGDGAAMFTLATLFLPPAAAVEPPSPPPPPLPSLDAVAALLAGAEAPAQRHFLDGVRQLEARRLLLSPAGAAVPDLSPLADRSPDAAAEIAAMAAAAARDVPQYRFILPSGALFEGRVVPATWWGRSHPLAVAVPADLAEGYDVAARVAEQQHGGRRLTWIAQWGRCEVLVVRRGTTVSMPLMSALVLLRFNAAAPPLPAPDLAAALGLDWAPGGPRAILEAHLATLCRHGLLRRVEGEGGDAYEPDDGDEPLEGVIDRINLSDLAAWRTEGTAWTAGPAGDPDDRSAVEAAAMRMLKRHGGWLPLAEAVDRIRLDPRLLLLGRPVPGALVEAALAALVAREYALRRGSDVQYRP